jgi:hypothetical protein
VLAACALTACAADVRNAVPTEGTGSIESELLVASNTWPKKAIKVCWRPTAAESSGGSCHQASKQDDTTHPGGRLQIRTAVENSWSTVSKVRFTGWGLCAGNDECDPNVIAIYTGNDFGGAGRAQVGYFPASGVAAWAAFDLNASGTFLDGVARQEFGHALAFLHEHKRNDAPASAQFCGGAEWRTQGTSDTAVGAYDPNSVMEYSYCQNTNYNISATDTLGIRTFYGPRGEDTVLAIRSDQYLYEKHYSGGWTPWNLLSSGKTSNSPPAVTITKDGDKAFFVRQSDNHLWTGTIRNGVFIGWYDLGYVGVSIGPPAAVATESASGGPLYLTVFARQDDDRVYFKNYDPAIGNWTSSWSWMGSTQTFNTYLGIGAAVSDSRQTVVFVLGFDGNIYHKWANSGLSPWSEWTLVPGGGGGSFNSGPAAVTTAEGRLTVFTTKTDGAVYHNYYDPNLGYWSGWSSLGGNCQFGVTASVSPEGRLVLYCWWASTSTLYSRFNDQGTWYPWQQLDSTVINSRPGAMQ